MWERARGDTASRRNYGLTFSLPLPPCRKAYRYRLAASGNYKQPWPWLFVEAAESDSIVSGSSSGGANVLSAVVTALARNRRASSSVVFSSKPWLRAIAFALCGTTSCKTKLGPIQTIFSIQKSSPQKYVCEIRVALCPEMCSIQSVLCSIRALPLFRYFLCPLPLVSRLHPLVHPMRAHAATPEPPWQPKPT